MSRPLNRAQMINVVAQALQHAWLPQDVERAARDIVVRLQALGLVSFDVEPPAPPAQKTPEEVLQLMVVGPGCGRLIDKSDAARIIAKLKAAGYWLTPVVSLGCAEVVHKAAEAKLAAMTQAAAQPEPPPPSSSGTLASAALNSDASSIRPTMEPQPKMATPAQVLSGIMIEDSALDARISDRDAERLVTILKGAGYEIVLRGGPGLGPKREKRPVAFRVPIPADTKSQEFKLFYDEREAALFASSIDATYDGLYVRDGT